MDFYPLWPYFVSVAALLALIAAPIFAMTESPAQATEKRQLGIDGLRGFLAFGVFFGHAAVYHDYVTSGRWAAAPIPTLYTLLAQCSVALFFIITGYLFWGKLLRDNGRPRWIALYTGRLFRIGPLYLSAIVVMFLIVAIRSGWALHESPFVVFKEVAHWALLGSDQTSPDINGYQHTSILLAGVTWTLAFEWQFYASLLGLTFVARLGLTVALIAVLAAFVAMLIYLLLTANPNHDPTRATCAFLFLCGMLVASLEVNGFQARLPKMTLSGLMAACLAIIYETGTGAYAPVPALLLCAVFFLVASGGDLLGLLSFAPARRLGNISFGVYLLQGLVLTTVFSSNSLVSFALLSPNHYWLIIFGCAVLLMIVSSLMHVLVELPGIAAGRQVISFLARKQAFTAHRFKAGDTTGSSRFSRSLSVSEHKPEGVEK